MSEHRGAQSLVKEQAVAAEAFDLTLDGRVGDTVLPRQLAMTGAADLAMEQSQLKLGTLEPVRRGECL